MDDADDEPQLRFRVRCSRRVRRLWGQTVQLACQVAGAELTVAQAAEVIGAEGLSGEPGDPGPPSAAEAPSVDEAAPVADLDWEAIREALPADVETLDDGLDCDVFALDARPRAAVRARQRIDWQLGRLLRVFLDRRLHRALGFPSAAGISGTNQCAASCGCPRARAAAVSCGCRAPSPGPSDRPAAPGPLNVVHVVGTADPREDQSMTNATAVATLSEPAPAPDFRFRDGLARIADAHRPSRHPFFAALGALPAEVARDRRFLGRLHLTYQATMHATRAMVYHLPYLDSPALRIRKVGIFVDDDGLAGGDTHHYQLTRAFRRMGARLVLDDEDFGDLDSLCRHLEPRVAGFVQLVKCLYPRSLGPWCIVELLSDGWMRALAAGLARHFPGVIREPYFADCFTEGVEERHAAESLEITEMILARRPELLPDMLADARVVAEGLDDVWDSLHDLVRAAAGR